MGELKVTLELTIHKAEVIRRALQHYSPPLEDEMVSAMLFYEIKAKIAEAVENGHDIG